MATLFNTLRDYVSNYGTCTSCDATSTTTATIYNANDSVLQQPQTISSDSYTYTRDIVNNWSSMETITDTLSSAYDFSYHPNQRMFCLAKILHTHGVNDDIICKRIEKNVKLDFANKLLMLINEDYYTLPYSNYFWNTMQERFKRTVIQPHNTSKLAEITIEKDDLLPFIVLMQEEKLESNKQKLQLKNIENLFGENSFPSLRVTIYKSNDGKDYYYCYE